MQWICNDHMGFWIRDRGRQVVKTAGRNRSASNARCGAGYNATRCVCLYRSAGSWFVLTGCIRRSGWSNYWPSLCSKLGGSNALSDICNARIVQRRRGGGVLTLDCRGHGTPSLRGIPLASRYGNASLNRRKLRITWRPTLMLILMIGNNSNLSYDRSRVRVRALARHIPIYMFDVQKVGIISSACIWNGRWGRHLFEWPWTDSTKKGGAV